MSPILKRDISDHLYQARRLAAAATGQTPPNREPPYNDTSLKPPRGYASGSSPRLGIGIDEGEVGYQDTGGGGGEWRATKAVNELDLRGKGKNRASFEESEEAGWRVGEGTSRTVSRDQKGDLRDQAIEVESDGEGEEETGELLQLPQGRHRYPPSRGSSPKLQTTSESEDSPSRSKVRLVSGGQWRDLRSLLLESTPSLLLSLVGLVFTGELLEHLARWRVFRRVDELFILVPMIGNLKGNLEMCLSARLGTSANIGELDHRITRRALVQANLTLLGLQALLISSLAAFVSFLLGLMTVHRLGDAPPPPNDTLTGIVNSTLASAASAVLDPGLAVGEQEWREGYTRPGWKQLAMVLATGMGAAGLSSAVLGSFMSSLIVVSRWVGLDPDNITPPVAACLGDLLTLFILSLLGTALVGTMDTPIPLIAVVLMTIAAAWFTRRVTKNEWVKNVAKGGWAPLIGAMLISSGTGMVLDQGVGNYRGFALLAISMTGLTGSIGAIHANRLSTSLHTGLHPSSQTPRPNTGLTPIQSAITLYLIAFPCQGCFLAFVSWAGWVDFSLGLAGWMTFAVTTLVSLGLAHFLTLFFWSKDLDPDSYALPILSALVDFIGQLLLMVAFEIRRLQGEDVTPLIIP